jgi:hypothetical protein
MCLFPILFRHLTALGHAGTKMLLPSNSRFGGFNSRLGRGEVPFRIAAGIRPQHLDSACGLWEQTDLFQRKAKNSRFDGNYRELDLPAPPRGLSSQLGQFSSEPMRGG